MQPEFGSLSVWYVVNYFGVMGFVNFDVWFGLTEK